MRIGGCDEIKAKNRKDRIEFLIRKQGLIVTQMLLSATDREAKRYYEEMYFFLKNRDDVDDSHAQTPCDRCSTEVLWHSECGCGFGRAVFDEERWADGIEGNDDRIAGDEEFLKRQQA